MPRLGFKKRRAWGDDPLDPQGLVAWMARYLTGMRIKNYADQSVRRHEEYLLLFFEWCHGRALHRPDDITKPILERYQRHLFHYRRPSTGNPLSFREQHFRLVPVRLYFKWLCRQNVLLYNPASELEIPRVPKSLPKHVMTAEEVEQVLSQPDIREVLGLRDRAILEVLYSTGMRRSEIVGLDIYDVDESRNVVMIREGKGKKDRVCPIGERALLWLRKYLDEVRPELVIEDSEHAIFLGYMGDRLKSSRITQLARQYIEAANIGKKGSSHTFRHTAATLMLENGADIRFIQQMLGHSSLTSTQIYTHVSVRQLQKVHEQTHPAAKLRSSDERGEIIATPSLAAHERDELAVDGGDDEVMLDDGLQAEAEVEDEELTERDEGDVS